MKPSDWFSLGAFLSAIAVIVWLVASMVRADGRVSYCRVDHGSYGLFFLYGHRDWRLDANLGVYLTLEAAINAAKIHQCPLGVK